MYDPTGRIYPVDLVVNKKYAWLMGAEPLTCTYLGRGIKAHFSYRFQLGNTEHEIGYTNVRKYIGDFYFFQPVNPS